MRHTNRRFMFIALALISVLLVFTLTACGSDNSDDSNKPVLNTGTEYYLHGNEEAGFLKFNEDETVDIEIINGTMYLYAGTAS